MSDWIIKVENLGKKYRIQHNAERQRYTALRDVIAEKAKGLFRKLKPETGNLKSSQVSSLKSQVSSRSASEDFWALKDVNFEVKQGEVVGIIGRNGAGKSTLLKILSRITEPTTGSVRLRGRVASLLEVGTGFHPELTGRENIFLNGAILGMSRAEIRKKFDEIVAFAEVEKFLDTPVKRYSSGMYVRLAFAVAAHLEPEILIVDEVLAVGDATFQKKCLGKMKDVAEYGRTVLFVSHQMGAVVSLCNKAIFMNAGSTVATGSVQEIVRRYLSLASVTGNNYSIDSMKRDTKKNQIMTVQIESENGIVGSEFSYSDHICLTIKLSLPHISPTLLLGVGFDNMLQIRIFTILRKASEIKNTNDSGFCITRLKLPSRLIAPGSYSFTLAIFEHNGTIQDHLQNVCFVRILDDGTPYSSFEGMDYGSVIVDAHWTE